MNTNYRNRAIAIGKFYADLEALKKLEPGWDSYKATPIKQSAFDLAAQAYGRLRFVFGNHCQPVPGSSGDVQLEWHERGFDIEVFISATEAI